MQIAGRKIGLDSSPFVIAEMSGNHNQSIDRAIAIIDAAADAGAHAIKLQTYTAETITLPITTGEFAIDDPQSPWKGKHLAELYRQAYTPWEWHAELFRHAARRGLICFSSPFDESAVDFLEELGAPAYKIASFENVHIPLIRKAAATGKPLIISTGMATLDELSEAVACARKAGCRSLALLKCTSTYPASPIDSNVRTIPHMRELFACEVGLSDHTMGIGAAVAAVAHGASLVEKHFTLRRADGGVDSTFSLEPLELRSLVVETERAWQALGKVQYGPAEHERASRSLRRSLYVARDIDQGEILTPNNLRCVRPGLGLAPKYYDLLMGKRVNCKLTAGMPMKWEYVMSDGEN